MNIIMLLYLIYFNKKTPDSQLNRAFKNFSEQSHLSFFQG